MFHNYKMSEIMQPVCMCRRVLGIEGECSPLGNMAMGLVYSHFVTTRIFYWAAAVINGERKMSSNPFFWDVVIKNSPVPPLMIPPCQGFTYGIQFEG